MRRFPLLFAAIFAAASPVLTDVEELFSRHVRVFHPQGDFPKVLTAVIPPPTTWQELGGTELPIQIRVPPKSNVDTAISGSRVLQVVFPGESTPKGILRVDRFHPAEGEPTSIDAEYVDDYAAEYPKQAFGGKFTLTERGMIVLGKKTRFAMVGGTYPRGAIEMNRLQWAYLSKEQQLFFTFDCATADWERYSDTLARTLLSVTVKGSPESRPKE